MKLKITIEYDEDKAMFRNTESGGIMALVTGWARRKMMCLTPADEIWGEVGDGYTVDIAPWEPTPKQDKHSPIPGTERHRDELIKMINETDFDEIVRIMGKVGEIAGEKFKKKMAALFSDPPTAIPQAIFIEQLQKEIYENIAIVVRNELKATGDFTIEEQISRTMGKIGAKKGEKDAETFVDAIESTPTRTLAQQIGDEIRKILKDIRIEGDESDGEYEFRIIMPN
jgi:hypothetical protein